MLSSEVITNFRNILLANFIGTPYAGVIIKSGYQPTQQGRENLPAIYYYLISPNQYGFISKSQTLSEDGKSFIVTETQEMEDTYQFNAIVQEDPQNISFNANDLIVYLQYIFNAQTTRDAFKAVGLSNYRAKNANAVYFRNDSNQYDKSLNLQVTFNYQNSYIKNMPVIESFSSRIQTT